MVLVFEAVADVVLAAVVSLWPDEVLELPQALLSAMMIKRVKYCNLYMYLASNE